MTTYPLEFIFGKKVTCTPNGLQRVLYGVKWQNYSVEKATYEPQRNFKDRTAIEEYEFLQDIQTMNKYSDAHDRTYVVCQGELEVVESSGTAEQIIRTKISVD